MSWTTSPNTKTNMTCQKTWPPRLCGQFPFCTYSRRLKVSNCDRLWASSVHHASSVNFFFKLHLLNHLSKFKIISHECSPLNALYQNCINAPVRRIWEPPELYIRNNFKDIWIIERIPHDALYQNCTNGSPPPNKGATRALDKKYLKRYFLLNQWSKFKIIAQKCFW